MNDCLYHAGKTDIIMETKQVGRYFSSCNICICSITPAKTETTISVGLQNMSPIPAYTKSKPRKAGFRLNPYIPFVTMSVLSFSAMPTFQQFLKRMSIYSYVCF